METSEIINSLSSVVSNNLFPIVACVFMYKQQLTLNDTINNLSSTLKGIDTRLEIIERGVK